MDAPNLAWIYGWAVSVVATGGLVKNCRHEYTAADRVIVLF